MKPIPDQPHIIVFQGGPKDGETTPYRPSSYQELKAAPKPIFNIGNWYTDNDPLPFEQIQWVHYTLKKAIRQFYVPYKIWETNPDCAEARYTVKVYQDHHIDMAYVYQVEGNTDNPVVPEEAWFGRRTSTELVDCFQSSNSDAYIAWVQEEDVMKQLLKEFQ